MRLIGQQISLQLTAAESKAFEHPVQNVYCAIKKVSGTLVEFIPRIQGVITLRCSFVDFFLFLVIILTVPLSKWVHLEKFPLVSLR